MSGTKDTIGVCRSSDNTRFVLAAAYGPRVGLDAGL